MTRTTTLRHRYDTLLEVLGHFDTLLGLGVLGNDHSDAGHGGGGNFPQRRLMMQKFQMSLFDLKYSFEAGQNQASSSSSHLSAL